MKIPAIKFVLLAAILTFRLSFASVTDDIGYATAESIPDGVVQILNQKQFSKNYQVVTHLNPFYVTGNFSGHGRLDTAILIKNRASGEIGVAIIHQSSNSAIVLGAGRNFGNGGSNFDWMDAWHVWSKVSKVKKGVGEADPPRRAQQNREQGVWGHFQFHQGFLGDWECIAG